MNNIYVDFVYRASVFIALSVFVSCLLIRTTPLSYSAGGKRTGERGGLLHGRKAGCDEGGECTQTRAGRHDACPYLRAVTERGTPTLMMYIFCGLPQSLERLCGQIQRSRVRLPALPDVLRSSGFGTESTQPRELHPLSEKVGTNFADKRRSLCWYSLLAH
jgi:hypothetical protein